MANNIDIYQLYKDCKSNLNVKQGGPFRLRDFNSWVNQISIELFNDYFSDWEKSQQISDKLSQPFLSSEVVIATKSKLNYSLFPYPSNYAYFSSARIFVTSDDKVISCPKKTGEDTEDSILSDVCERNVNKVDNARWGSVCSHPIIYPTLDRVFISQYESGFKVAPKDVAYISIDYLRYPKKAELVLTNGQVYDAAAQAATKPLEWNDSLRNEFAARISKAFGVFIREPFLYATSKTQEETIG